MKSSKSNILQTLATEKDISDSTAEALNSAIEEFKKTF